MSKVSWVRLTASDRTLLSEALAMMQRLQKDRAREVKALATKLAHAAPHPQITIGVHGGQVQWAVGNPFPIRVCDYDGTSDDELPDLDDQGQCCRMWWEPADDVQLGTV
jgi:hypothetical protein